MKKAIKKAVSVLLAVLMVFGSLAGLGVSDLFCLSAEAYSFSSGWCGSDVTWTVDTNKFVINIVGTGPMNDWSSYAGVPWQDYKFYYIRTVNILNGVTSIGGYAFADCDELTSVTIPDSIIKIGDSAFAHCPKLASVTIPENVKYIELAAFYGCSRLKNISIPDSVISIGEVAFRDCDALESVTIGSGLTTLSDDAFYSCGNIQSITVDADNKYYLSDSNSVVFNKEKTQLVLYPSGSSIKKYTVPNGVITIGECAFNSAGKLRSVAFSDSVTSIGSSALAYCNRLTSVSIPDSVTSIGSYAFYESANLTDVYYAGSEEQWNNISIGDKNDPLMNAQKHFNHVHDLILQEEVVPTCTEGGYKEYSCVCGYGLVEEEEALGHDMIIYEAVASTCTTTGMTAGQRCSRCDDVTIKQMVVLELGHNIVIDEAVASTCTSTGLTEGQHCSRCDDKTVKQTIVPELGHNIVIDEAVASTCTSTGLTSGQHCSRCDDETVEQTIVPELGHDIVIDEAVVSTCTSTGLTAGQHCSRCDDKTVKQETVPAKAHNYKAENDLTNHWKECDCGAKINKQKHSFGNGNICSCGFRRTVDSTIKIKNNSSSKTINYGESLRLTAIVTNQPSNAKICWYIDGVKAGEGDFLYVSFESGTKYVTVKLVYDNGALCEDTESNEISDSQTVTVKSGFFQKIVSFFKNLFGMNRTIIQAFKSIY